MFKWKNSESLNFDSEMESQEIKTKPKMSFFSKVKAHFNRRKVKSENPPNLPEEEMDPRHLPPMPDK